MKNCDIILLTVTVQFVILAILIVIFSGEVCNG